MRLIVKNLLLALSIFTIASSVGCVQPKPPVSEVHPQVMALEAAMQAAQEILVEDGYPLGASPPGRMRINTKWRGDALLQRRVTVTIRETRMWPAIIIRVREVEPFKEGEAPETPPPKEAINPGITVSSSSNEVLMINGQPWRLKKASLRSKTEQQRLAHLVEERWKTLMRKQ